MPSLPFSDRGVGARLILSRSVLGLVGVVVRKRRYSSCCCFRVPREAGLQAGKASHYLGCRLRSAGTDLNQAAGANDIPETSDEAHPIMGHVLPSAHFFRRPARLVGHVVRNPLGGVGDSCYRSLEEGGVVGLASPSALVLVLVLGPCSEERSWAEEQVETRC